MSFFGIILCIKGSGIVLKNIFDIEVRIDINKEFRKMVNYLHHITNTTFAFGNYTTFINAIDSYAFKRWKYRGTAINCKEFLENIGIPNYYFEDRVSIKEENFLYYIEFVYNIYYFSYSNGYIEIEDENVKAIIENLDIIAEKLNYKFIICDDKYLLIKRNADVDSILPVVDEEIGKYLLEYNDIRIRTDLKRKNEILKHIDKYIEKQKSILSKIDSVTYNSIGYIMNNYGINHKMNDKYLNISDAELLKWYDKCFLLSIHLIRTLEIKDINKERKSLEISNDKI